jgi:hypothetical protein
MRRVIGVPPGGNGTLTLKEVSREKQMAISESLNTGLLVPAFQPVDGRAVVQKSQNGFVRRIHHLFSNRADQKL